MLRYGEADRMKFHQLFAQRKVVIPPGEDHLKRERNAIQTLVASRASGGWQIEMFQNTPARFDGRPEEADRLTRELEEELGHS